MIERREIRADGEEVGDLTLPQLMRAIERAEFDGALEYLSVKTGEWLPVVGILNDYIDHDRLADLREAGVRRVSVIGAGDDCPVCYALTGRVLEIGDVPSLPPPGCSCIPWCRCTLIASG